jgi:hypothetical protein
MNLIVSVSAALIVLGLTACGGSGSAGFTVGNPPTKPSEFSTVRPSPQMANEAEDLIADKYRGMFASPKCVPTDSLDGTGEFNFDCTAEDLKRGERIKFDVTVKGSESGEPELGPVIGYMCDPVNSRGEDLPRTC